MPTKEERARKGAEADDPKPKPGRPRFCRVCSNKHPYIVGFKAGYCGYCWGNLKLIQRAIAANDGPGTDAGDRGMVHVGKIVGYDL